MVEERRRAHEGYLRNFPPYQPPVGPGLWVPTPPGFLPALQPFWGGNGCLALRNGAAIGAGAGSSLAAAAEAYACVGVAVCDAFIACWYWKYIDNLLRPVTYIKRLIDPEWLPPLVTPPFPEYPSGHSVQSGAAFEVLTDLFGERYAFVDRTHDTRGLPQRSFGSFLEAAEEAAVSRLYGGIHFRSAIV
jgi:membrane-associated phospholipid phosphatase